MTRITSWLTSLSIVALGASATLASARSVSEDAVRGAATLLRLRDGSIQWGNIAAHDPEGIVFERLDTGGRVRLAWPLLHPEEERDLRQKWGYVDLTGEEIQVGAERIEAVDGSEIIGLIVDRTGDNLLVKTASATITLPKNRIATITPVQVPSTEIFTRAELYSSALANADTTSAAGHFDLAQYCERILDFAHAVEHYKKAHDLDAAFRPADWKVALDRATEKAARQDQVDYLSDVDVLLARRRFDEAIAKAEGFKDKYADSPLIPQAKRARDRAVKARDQYVTERVATLWFLRTGQLARQAGLKMSFEEAVNYAGGTMQKEVIDGVAKEVVKLTKEATGDAVKKLWLVRKKSRWYSASYGLGTWLLGKDAALKGSQPESAQPKAPVNEKDKERMDLEKKLQQYLKNQETARKTKSSAEQKDDREVAWKELSAESRSGWILAYYAENSGDFELNPKPVFHACRECGGEGTRVMSLVGANVAKSAIGKQSTDMKMECPTCHGLGVVRKISYR